MPLSKEDARENLEELIAKFYQLTQEQKGEVSESSVFGSFILPLFRDVLGWPTEDVTKFAREQAVVRGRRVDGVLHLESGERVFVEAKRFSAIQRLSNSNEWTMGPGQLSLPSMATDRTREEQQAINYAFENGGKWAILSNFERLRLFNARRDWLVLAFETPAAYKDDFEQLWQLSWEEIHRGSLERMDNQRIVKDVDTNYLDFINQQREQLAIDITLNREANAWAYSENGELRLAALRAVVQRFLDRLVVVRFAEDHFVIDSGSMKRAYEYGKDNPYAREPYYYLREFFRRFDENHNSALFSLSEVDDAAFSETVLNPLMEQLYEARFRAMPADIIGNTYEEYLAKTIVLEDGVIAIKDNLETRKEQGSYYTPQYIVEFIVDHTLGRFLYGTQDGSPNGIRAYGEVRKTSTDIRDLRVLDSACGSGSFLIYAYQVLARFYESEITRLTEEFDQKVKDIAARFESATIDDRIEAQRIEDEREFLRKNYRQLILENHLYGVDLDPQAAEIAVMNLILRALEGSKQSDKLPLILNQNIKVGNSLVGLRPDDAPLEDHAEALATIRRLRIELIETDHNEPRHEEIQLELDGATQGLQREFQRQYSISARPFHWHIEFPEVFVDENGQPLDDPGFHFVFGNPPYGAKLSDSERNYFRREFNIGMTNSAGLFMVQSQRLLRRNGGHGLIVPKSFLYASNWRKLRERLVDGLEIIADCGRGWAEVLLEQAIYIHRNNEHIQNYRNLTLHREGKEGFENVDKRECLRFKLLLNGISALDLVIAHRMRDAGRFLREYITNRRGAGLQSRLKTEKIGYQVIGGRNVQRYHLSGIRGYFENDIVPDNALMKAGSILAQTMIAFIERPMPHIKITAHIVSEDESEMLILDKVNQINVTNNEISPHFVLALFHSKLLNWYVYRFIVAKPIRTMQFDNPITNRIPLPDFAGKADLVEKITAEVKAIYSNRHANEKSSQKRIDQYIYQLYGLSQEQIVLVEANMP
ncbi:MAG: N-6 DNA methylase [Chloroflexi bacterium]|nr:N-6 DNA methylase [Chloroflexota bacterium]